MRALIAPVAIILVVAFALPVCASDPIEDLGEALADFVAGIRWGLFDLQLCVRIRLAIDFSSDVTRPFLLSHIDPEHQGSYNIAQVCDMWDHCLRNWVYIPDPYNPFDRFYSASDTILAGLRGDCDDFAILVAAAVRLIGGTALIYAERTRIGGHAYTMVYVGSDIDTVASNLLYVMARYGLTVEDAKRGELCVIEFPSWGFWLPLDRSKTYPGGPLWAERSMLVDSHYLPTPSRYGLLVEPILTAPYTSLELTIEEFGYDRVAAVLAED